MYPEQRLLVISEHIAVKLLVIFGSTFIGMSGPQRIGLVKKFGTFLDLKLDIVSFLFWSDRFNDNIRIELLVEFYDLRSLVGSFAYIYLGGPCRCCRTPIHRRLRKE